MLGRLKHQKNLLHHNPKAVAVVANRYDGIDFPDNECRLLIIKDLSKATNLQENFFVKRMAATILLNDRISTRIVQAFGRCTRGATDYAAIFISSEELQTYLLKAENRSFLHPELQAEIEFGIEQSKEISVSELIDNFKIFLKQGDEWNAADSHILAIRQHKFHSQLPCTSSLQSAVEHEIDYSYALWHEDVMKALESSRKVLTELMDSELRGYRALWNYLAGNIAWLATQKGQCNLELQVMEYYNMAKSCAQGVRWLSGLGKDKSATESNVSGSDPLALTIIENLESIIENLGISQDYKFSQQEKRILDNLQQADSKKFEYAHEELGRILGYNAGNKESTGSPDPWWMVDETFCFVFEDHSDGKVDSGLKVNKARQAATHPNWIKDNLSLSSDATVISILITPVKKADYDALPHLKDVYLWDLDEFRKWASNALAIVRELRNTFPEVGDLAWRAIAVQKYKANKMDPVGLSEFLKNFPAAELLIP